MLLTIGTRASRLAMYQTHLAKNYLESAYPDIRVAVKTIATEGDKRLETNIADLGGKGAFVKEIEDALLRKDIDIAVHSLKDMPAELPEGLILSGYLQREDPRDVLVSRTGRGPDGLPRNAIVATSSPRRAAWMLHRRPDVKIIPFRGNVETRLRKLEDGAADATFLAAAGLKRLNLWEEKQHLITAIEAPDCIPAPGQGIIALQTREEDNTVNRMADSFTSEEARMRALCERAFLRAFGDGSCLRPIGGYSEIHENTITLHSVTASLDGVYYFRRADRKPLSDYLAAGEAAGAALKRVTDDIITPHEKISA